MYRVKRDRCLSCAHQDVGQPVGHLRSAAK